MKERLRTRFSEAVKFKEQGNFDGAKNILLDLVREDPQSTALLAVLGHVYWEMGLLEEAVGVFMRAIQLSPKLEAVSLGLFHCLWKLGRRAEALDEIKRFMSLSYSEDYQEIINEINKEPK
jgi:predicted Zn-dependent protease